MDHDDFLEAFPDFPGDGHWEVPPYLVNLYALWTLVGSAGEQMNHAHHAAEQVAEGYTDPSGVEIPPDTVMDAFLDLVPDDGEVRVHDYLVVAEAAIHTLAEAVAEHLKDMDALPPWWKEDYDPAIDRPVMGWELLMWKIAQEQQRKREDGEDEA